MAGWSAFGSRCFKFFYNLQTWIDAEKFCLQFDGNLASVHSHEEYAFIQNLIRSETQATTRAWIGGNDAVHVCNLFFYLAFCATGHLQLHLH
ncbi:hypothetical protein PO909_000321 [Leuciscus waleckii]